MTNTVNVILVDTQDNILGVMEKMEAHLKGVLHRAFSVMIFRDGPERIELLLQQRSSSKYHCANLWSNSCCSHPYLHENLIISGQTRLQEELGFTTKLTHLTSFRYCQTLSNGLIEHELDHILIGRYDKNIELVDTREAQAIKWVEIKFLQNWLTSTPHNFTPWFNLLLTIILKPKNKLFIQKLLNLQQPW